MIYFGGLYRSRQFFADPVGVSFDQKDSRPSDYGGDILKRIGEKNRSSGIAMANDIL